MSDLLLLKLMPPRRGSGTIERSGLIKKLPAAVISLFC